METKNTPRNARRVAFRNAIISAGIDIKKDFFALSFSDIDKIDQIRKTFGYDGSNYLGRSKARQFYYSAQSAK